MSDEYKVSKTKAVGKIPPRQELTVLPAKPEEKAIGWSCYEITGTDAYRPPQDAVWPPTTLEECRAIGVPENLVTTKDGLVEGEELLVQDLLGLNIATVHFHSEDGAPYGMSESGNLMFMLEFVDDRPGDEPPRWVCTGSANLKGLKRLNFTSPVS
tara:strand:+ start:2778 stop:3245 length:468 start_codon:yes stop_codon:yes gene_type:complete